MAKEKMDHRCVTCGAYYHSCDLCPETANYTPWRALCDTSRHYQVYMIISMIRGGVMNKFEAKESLLHIGVTLDEIKTFVPAVQEILLPIMEEVIVESKLDQTYENNQIKTDIDKVEPHVKSKRK